MVAQHTLSTCEGNWVFFNSFFNLTTAVDVCFTYFKILFLYFTKTPRVLKYHLIDSPWKIPYPLLNTITV